MLIDSFAPRYDAIETHAIDIDAPPERVVAALQTTDFAASPVIRALMGLRSLPAYLFGRKPRGKRPPPAQTLERLRAAGFGVVAEEKNRELLLGVTGYFWRPVGNILPFDRANFDGAIPPGAAIGLWNFAVEPRAAGTRLSTETRVVCSDRSSRRKFRAYWLIVGPFSALIRRVMLRAVKREAEKR